ncbi:conserved Plasmodium protein, unknown function [Plasmodium ovale]|uniref:KELT protein n=2 Tax=Plasmodium ovale TaxID=36330 RepID=A0A1A8W8S7_PLAOA|nr:KELT protein [Plasmodium ovale curtisi]SBS99548.1 KELT protein [Plasmodium ovale curtisi]SCP05925.1 conserved Plasmodium protein, unknown function [Plasmodium ovale]
MTHFYMLTIFILLYTHTYWKVKKCVRKVNLAERELSHKRKGSNTEDEFDEESFTTHMSLLSMSYTEKENDEKLEELGAAGGIAEIVEIEDSLSSEYDEEHDRRRRGSKRKFDSKDFEEHEETSKETQGEVIRKKQLQEHTEEQSSSSSENNKSDKSSIDVVGDSLDVFAKSVIECHASLPTISTSSIQEYLDAGISGEEGISRLHDNYPLNQSKKIDFKNLRSPFGTEVRSLKDLDEEQINNIFFIDDFLQAKLSDFLKNTQVGNLSLEHVYSLYKEGRINYIPCNNNMLEHLASMFSSFNIKIFLCKNSEKYLGTPEDYVCHFRSEKIFSIQENAKKDMKFLEYLKKKSKDRHLTNKEKKLTKQVIYAGLKNLKTIKQILSINERKIEKIMRDLKELLDIFPVNIKYMLREDIIVTCLHYILIYSFRLINPLHQMFKNKEFIEYKRFFSVSSLLNELINLLEILEFNSNLYNIFTDLYPDFNKHCPRLQSLEDIEGVFNFLIMKIYFVVVIFNLSKFLSKMDMCTKMIEDYKENGCSLYNMTLINVKYILREAKEIVKELT